MVTILATIVLLGVLITVHELGHFVVAKLSGIKVHVFSIGFGKAIVKFRRGETEYRIAQLPLGGYVHMAGQNPYEPEDQSDVGRRFSDKPPWVRILVALAGPAMNLLLPFVILPPFFYLSPQFDEVFGVEVGAVDRGLPAWSAGLRAGDRIDSINGDPVRAFWQITQHIEGYDESQGSLEIQVSREGVEDPVTLEIRPEKVRQTDGMLGVQRAPYRVGYTPRFLASDVAIADPHGPLHRAGLRTFDRVFEVNGEPIRRYVDLLRTIARAPPAEPITLKVERTEPATANVSFIHKRIIRELEVTLGAARTEADLGIRHAGTCVTARDADGPAKELQVGDCILAVDGEPHTLQAFLLSRLTHEPATRKTLEVLRAGEIVSVTMQLEQITRKDPLADEIKLWRRGLALLTRHDALIPLSRVPNHDRIAHAWYATVDQVDNRLWLTIQSISGILSGHISPRQLSGPLTIAYLAGRSAEQGLSQFVSLMVLISLSLALLNLFPVPGLDGGLMLVATIEMITRRRLPVRLQTGLNYGGYVLIAALLVFAFSNDVVRMWRILTG